MLMYVMAKKYLQMNIYMSYYIKKKYYILDHPLLLLPQFHNTNIMKT